MQVPTTLTSADHDDRGSTDRSHMAERPGHTEFFRAYYRKITALLAGAGFSWEIADDSTAQAMLEAHRNWDRITYPRAWVMSAARRAAVKEEKTRRTEVSTLTAKGYGTDRRDGTEEYRNLELHDEVLEVLNHLEDKQREVFSLKILGCSDNEIANALDMDPQTVRSNIRHARTKLKKILEGRHSEEERR